MLVLGWEAINPVMPSLLQKISVASYLRHLMPITIPGQGVFALLTVETEPVAQLGRAQHDVPIADPAQRPQREKGLVLETHFAISDRIDVLAANRA